MYFIHCTHGQNENTQFKTDRFTKHFDLLKFPVKMDINEKMKPNKNIFTLLYQCNYKL